MANNVAERCTVHLGDNQATAPALAGRCDRVHLGLIPSSLLSWPLACAALRRDRPGMLHIHENVHKAETEAFTLSLVEKLRALLGADWAVEVLHVEKVKWYAPKVRHVVFDVRCTPPGVAAHSKGAPAANSKGEFDAEGRAAKDLLSGVADRIAAADAQPAPVGLAAKFSRFTKSKAKRKPEQTPEQTLEPTPEPEEKPELGLRSSLKKFEPESESELEPRLRVSFKMELDSAETVRQMVLAAKVRPVFSRATQPVRRY